MPVVIGIDEAGYGPQLGPLVISSAAFQLPADPMNTDLWTLLDGAVCRSRRGANGRLLVADSKQVYGRGRGLDDLERAVLGFLAPNAADPPHSLAALMATLDQDADQLSTTAWWTDLPLPAATAPQDIRTAAARLEAPDVQCLGLATRVVPAPAFNRLTRRHGNKSVLLFQKNMELVSGSLARHPGDLTFLIDKHGGRHYYTELLANNFFGRQVLARSESPRQSVYEIALPDRTLTFAFIEKADHHHLPVALASMTSKYIRELCMQCFNAYWCGRVEGLEPTAGYAADSRRFIAAIRPLINDDDDVIRNC